MLMSMRQENEFEDYSVLFLNSFNFDTFHMISFHLVCMHLTGWINAFNQWKAISAQLALYFIVNILQTLSALTVAKSFANIQYEKNLRIDCRWGG